MHQFSHGKGTIISNSRTFDEDLMLKITKADCSDEQYQDYYNSLKGVSGKIKEFFPLLVFTILPTIKKTLAYIKGDLITREWLNEYGYVEAKEKGISFPIFALVPYDYLRTGIIVYDACNRINKNKIDYKFLHMNDGNELCTHKPVDITSENAVIDVLKSAWYLYTEYKKYERTNKFDLKCYTHGGSPYEN